MEHVNLTDYGNVTEYSNLTRWNVSSMERLPFTPTTKSVEDSNVSFVCNTTDLGNLSHTPSLQDIEWDFFIEFNIPAFCLMLILFVFGTIGNIHTILVYMLVKEMKDRPPSTLIIWLSSVDFLVCAACIPFEMRDLRHNYSNSHDGTCKFFRYFAHALFLMSGMLLVTLARERYQKVYSGIPDYTSRLACLSRLICAKKLKFQTAIFQYNCVCFAIFCISFSFTVPILVMTGIEEFDHLGTNGTECSVLKQYRDITIAGLYSMLIILIGVICLSICWYSYGRIIWLMYKQSKHTIRNREQTDINLTNLKNQSNTHIEERGHSSEDVVTQKTTTKTDDKFKKGKRLTMSLIIASFISWLAFMIFVSGAAIRVSSPEFEQNIRIISAVLIRVEFINNAINPVAYFLVDKKFRSAVKKLYVQGKIKVFGFLQCFAQN